MNRQQVLIGGGALGRGQFPRVVAHDPRTLTEFGQRLIQLLFIHVLLILPLAAQDASPKTTGWKWSLAALATANAADTATSWGKPEANPLLGDYHGARALTIKSASTAGLIALEWRYRKRAPRMLTVLNLAAAGALTIVAVRNVRVRGGIAQ